MKGFLNKVKGQVKGLISSPEKDTLKRTQSDKKEHPQTREDVVKECLNSQKSSKIFQILDSGVENESQASTKGDCQIYYKKTSPPLSLSLYEKLESGVSIESQKVYDLLTGVNGEIIQEEDPLFCIAVLDNHPEKGASVNYVYPDLKSHLNPSLVETIESSLLKLGLPELAPNVKEDHVYFIIDIEKNKFENLSREYFYDLSNDLKNNHALIYGVSVSKLFTEQPQLGIQKSVCILSRVPAFGFLFSLLESTTKNYFAQNDLNEKQALCDAFNRINSSIKQNPLTTSQLLAETCLKKQIYSLNSKFMTLWKAILLEKKVVVSSQHANLCSGLVYSLSTLFPANGHFRYQSKEVNLVENCLNEYGLPLRLFNENYILAPYIRSEQLTALDSVPGFFVGTSNLSITTQQKANCDILFDIDKNSIQFKNDSLKKALSLTSQDKEFIRQILKTIKANTSNLNPFWKKSENPTFENFEINGKQSEDWVREKFHNYLASLLAEIEFFRQCTSSDKLDPLIQNYKNEASLMDASPSSSPRIFDWNDEILQPEGELEGEVGSMKDFEESENEEEHGSDQSPHSSGKSKGSFISVGNSGVIDNDENTEGPEEPKTPEKVAVGKLETESFKAILKRELKVISQSNNTLKKYGFDWILEWMKTANFKIWYETKKGNIGERSVNNPSAERHLWFFENGDIYFGDLSFGQRSGQGSFVNRQAQTLYIGGWKEDKRSGEAKIISIVDGDTVFEGSFYKDKKHGFGKYDDGNIKYTGSYKEDKYEGNGILIDENENVYEGDFRGGLMCGVGKLQFSNKDVYRGEFLQGEYHGKGQLIEKNGNFYIGDYARGLRCGQGLYQTVSGESYEGAFKDDLYEGKGILKQKDGKCFEGEFSKGEFINNQEAAITYPDGSKYKGVVNNKKANGLGTLIVEIDGKIVHKSGRFENDNLVEEIRL